MEKGDSVTAQVVGRGGVDISQLGLNAYTDDDTIAYAEMSSEEIDQVVISGNEVGTTTLHVTATDPETGDELTADATVTVISSGA